ncbi:response regulator [Desulfurispira natronophila]|uniref:CheY-like chemotaxis protein n=1 Tax=Desulfurispira natronophila TaxID=682562 RepID=A0A7W8DGN7_9BACT|nr:response regulator [Desulfurispira natronophila]MBB5021569.1 CheY-like chemotaxis protein [Desulfurispira natronophila]
MLEDKVVLVAEDSSTMRRIIVSIIRDHLGCQNILEAANGREALALIYSNPVDWVFCDWEMPDMTGHELLREVRGTPSMVDIPFIMITTRKDKESIVAAIQSGASSYIVKPFTPRIITEKVEALLDNQERRRADRVAASGTMAVQLTLKDGTEFAATLMDLSVVGCQVQVSREFSSQCSIYDRMSINLEDTLNYPEGFIETKGVLMRMQAYHNLLLRHDQVRAAFQFLPMEPEQRKQVIALVEALEKAKCQRNGSS